ncbi:MAG: cation-translocating P-type ATPase [Acidobacteriota bacterium]
MKNRTSETEQNGLTRDEARAWFKLDAAEALSVLRADRERGLDVAEVERRHAEHGANELAETGAKNPWRILWEQFTAVMVLILIVAAAVSVVASGFTDFKNPIVIMAIVVLFALLGFFQEHRAERAMAALKKLAAPMVRVRRSGRIDEVSARELVPGDIVLLEAGNMIPADLRFLESVNLRVQEAALTGESEPVEKETGALAGDDLTVGDRRNMAYMGTVVTYGRGAGLVVETGMRTELGKIAGMLGWVEREHTPLQRRLDQLGKTLGVVAVGVAALVFGLGVLKGEPLYLMLMTAVGVAVAAVPEGLPAVVTITLALGAQRMLARNALIRKLPAVETLGSVTVICSDKTGTLTENRMTVTVLDVAGHRLDLTERSGEPLAVFAADPDPAKLDPTLSLLLAGGALCNDAMLQADTEQNRLQAVGDPTEGALVIAAARFGIRKDQLEEALPRVAELPFDSERKRMMTVHRFPEASAPLPLNLRRTMNGYLSQGAGDSPYISFVKGAVDGLLNISTHAWENHRRVPLSAEVRARIQSANDSLAASGMRVLGFAFRMLQEPTGGERTEALERDLTFVGLVGMIDPPRAEVKEAVAKCKSAGIRPVMITGDHPLTAAYIARDLGIINGGRVVTGVELEKKSDEELRGLVEDVSVYARVSPEHKFRIVEALQARGHIVAMTGDGVNDAPALKRANIGVAMGLTGTDVSKEAAEMVLRDDNFASIVAAVEEGRTIYDNLKKFIKFSIAGNIGKILTVLVGPLTGMPLVLQPLQLLWLNLLTDGLLGLGLGVEKSERNVMSRPPHAPGESMFARGMGRHIIWLGLLIGAVALGIGFTHWAAGYQNWQTMTFTTLAFLQVGQALATRSTHDSLFRIGVGSNLLMLVMVAIVTVLQLAVIYVPALQAMFGTQELPLADLAICAGTGAALFAAVEIEKWITRHNGAAAAIA